MRPPVYGPNVVAALIFCLAVLGMPAGKRLAPALSDLVPVLRTFGELDIDDATAPLLVGMSAATINRRLVPERKKHVLRGRSHTKPGTLLKSQIPIRTWAQWDDIVPGFVEIDLVNSARMPVYRSVDHVGAAVEGGAECSVQPVGHRVPKNSMVSAQRTCRA